jgi:hypothetical protein
MWESYSPEADLPGLTAYTAQRVKPDFVGWTGIGPIAMLIEDVVGLDVDAAGAQLTWDLRLTERHGVLRLRAGNGRTVDALCERRSSPEAPAEITLRSAVPLRAVLRVGAREQTTDLPPGAPVSLTV